VYASVLKTLVMVLVCFLVFTLNQSVFNIITIKNARCYVSKLERKSRNEPS